MDNFRAKFLARCLCDDQGQRLFSDEQIEKLAAKSAKVVSRLFDKAASHNAITEKDVEDRAKSGTSARRDGFGFGWRGPGK